MAFRTKQEKYAYKKGVRRGFAEAMGYKNRATSRTRRRRSKKHSRPGAYNTKKKPIMDTGLLFDYDDRGKIKGGYTADGFFEPD